MAEREVVDAARQRLRRHLQAIPHPLEPGTWDHDLALVLEALTDATRAQLDLVEQVEAELGKTHYASRIVRGIVREAVLEEETSGSDQA